MGATWHSLCFGSVPLSPRPDGTLLHVDCSVVWQRGGSNLVPIAFLDLEDRFHVQQHLPIPRAGRYVLIKMLRAQRAGENVDVQYIGFRGWTAPHAFEEGVLL